MATVFLIGNPEKPETFCDAEMVVRFNGHTVLNPLDIPEIWELQKAMIDVSDAVLILPGWRNSEGALRQYSYSQMKNRKKKEITYSLKREYDIRKALNSI